jgi:hypothetical protein
VIIICLLLDESFVLVQSSGGGLLDTGTTAAAPVLYAVECRFYEKS